MIILKSDPKIPFYPKEDRIPDEVRRAALDAPYQNPSYRSERRKSIWLIAEPNMTPGVAPEFTPAWRNRALEEFILSRGYNIAQLGLTHFAGGGIMPHRDATYAKPGLALGISLFGEATFYVWNQELKEKPTSKNAALIVTLQDQDIFEFHSKYLHAAWSQNPQRVSINAWKIRDDWRPALQETLSRI